ncbi:MAG: ribosome recycling factor [Planctomycetota bacterium]|nr:MAG: ribosome recycling factor [Planctomycetota bacterium]
MSLDEILLEAEEAMEKAVDFYAHELRSVRTGRASAGLVENLKIDVAAYGSTMSLRELANIAVTEGNTIVVKPFDPSTLKDIERGIEKSELGINPQNDGKMLRLPVPALSTERRNQIVARVKELAEQQRVTVRNARRDANKALAAAQKAKTITEDDQKSGEKQVQELTDKYCKKIDDLLEAKTKDIMEV